MTTTANAIRKNSAVRVIAHQHETAGRVGIVQKVSSDKTMITVKMLPLAPGEDGPVVTMAQYCFKLDRDVSANELMDVQSRRDVFVAEQEARMAEYIAAREAKARAKYIADRNAPVIPMVRDQRDDGSRIIWGERRPNSHYISTSIEVHVRESFGTAKIPEIKVNWSALGSVSPEEALEFAKTLAAAAIEAQAIRAQKERELGIVVHPEA